MRNQITTTRLLASLVVPLLFACGAENSGGGGGFVQVPQCDTAGQVLSTDSSGQLICKPLPAGALVLPNCKKYSEALTSDTTGVSCTNRNNDSAATTTALNNLETSEKLINEYTTRLGKINAGPAARAVYCGQSPAPPAGSNIGAAFTDGGATGIPATASLCSKVPTCGANARMCSVYDMYYSVASGVITNQMEVTKSWVYMASWSSEFADNSGAQKEAGSGQSDNCGGFTYPTADKHWYGTAVQWTVSDTGKKALKFWSGPGTVGVPGTTNSANNAFAVPCSSLLPIACCK